MAFMLTAIGAGICFLAGVNHKAAEPIKHVYKKIGTGTVSLKLIPKVPSSYTGFNSHGLTVVSSNNPNDLIEVHKIRFDDGAQLETTNYSGSLGPNRDIYCWYDNYRDTPYVVSVIYDATSIYYYVASIILLYITILLMLKYSRKKNNKYRRR